MNAPTTSFSLWYRDVLVGHVRDAFLSEGTWFGRFEPAFRPDDGGLPGRLREYVRFCENWNERQLAGLGDVEEFERYADVITSGLWETEDAAGERRRVLDAPVFFVGNEISWRLD